MFLDRRYTYSLKGWRNGKLIRVTTRKDFQGKIAGIKLRDEKIRVKKYIVMRGGFSLQAT
jgi:hypothetical protein